MERLTAKEIADAIGGKIILGKEDAAAIDVCMDSRDAKAGDLFVALIGANTDGHLYIKDAQEKGANLIMVSREDADVMQGATVILVEDTLKGLQDLSAWYIKRLGMKLVAVTGSVGKTSTRDLTYHAVKQKYTAGVSKRNYNSETGLPLTLLSFTRDMEVGVVEMGMDDLGEIHTLVDIARPDVAIITNIGVSHIEILGSRENIRKAKMEITDFFGARNTLIVNADDDMLAELRQEELPYRLITVGSGEDAMYRVSDITDRGARGISFMLETPTAGYHVELGVPGAHNAMNSALAIAAAEVIGESPEEAIEGMQSVELTGSRLKLVEARGITVIDDTYNAAPASMISALETLKHTDALRHVAVLGDMGELGDIAEEAHRSVGFAAAEKEIDVVLTVGSLSKNISDAAAEEAKRKGIKPEIKHFDTKDELYPFMMENLKAGDAVLVKASRSAALEDVVNAIESWRLSQEEAQQEDKA